MFATLLFLILTGCQKSDITEYQVTVHYGDSGRYMVGESEEVAAVVEYIDKELIEGFKKRHSDLILKPFTIESRSSRISDDKASAIFDSLLDDWRNVGDLGKKRIDQLDGSQTGDFSLYYKLELHCASYIKHGHSTPLRGYNLLFEYKGGDNL